MGSDDVPDLLSVCYYAGTFDNKPMIQSATELQDTYVRLDAEIAKLIDYIDKIVGLDNALIFVTSTGYDNEETQDLSKYRVPTGNFQINRCAALLNSKVNTNGIIAGLKDCGMTGIAITNTSNTAKLARQSQFV